MADRVTKNVTIYHTFNEYLFITKYYLYILYYARAKYLLLTVVEQILVDASSCIVHCVLKSFLYNFNKIYK